MVVVDRLTRFTHFVPLRHPFDAVQVDHAFCDNIVKLHGVPKTIVFDRDRIFSSVLWRDLFAGAGSVVLYSVPPIKGQLEREGQSMHGEVPLLHRP